MPAARVILPVLSLLAACTSQYTLRTEAETAFRQHNEVSSAVMLLLPELDPEKAETRALLDSDQHMLAACQPLNAVAVSRRDQRPIGIKRRLAAGRAIDACRSATAATRLLLDKLQLPGGM